LQKGGTKKITYTTPAPAGANALKKDINVVAKPFAVALCS
jgi:hypothetical protein